MKKLENVPEIVAIPFGDGRYIFKLGALLHSRNISIVSLMNGIESEYKVISKYIYGDLSTKLDMRVLSKLCDYFRCNLSDIIEYIPNQKD